MHSWNMHFVSLAAPNTQINFNLHLYYINRMYVTIKLFILKTIYCLIFMFKFSLLMILLL